MSNKLRLIFASILCCISLIGECQLTKDPRQILSQANNVLNDIEFVSYNYFYNGDGKFNGSFTGSVRLWKRDNYLSSYILAKLDFLDAKGKMEKSWTIAVIQGDISLYDEVANILKQGTLQGGSMSLMTYAYYVVLFQYLQINPFKRELENTTLQWVGEEVVDGNLCNVVKLKNQFNDWVYWYVGKEDFLLYAQRTENSDKETQGSFLFKIKNLNINQKIDSSEFLINYPEDVELINEDDKVIAVDQLAPAWQIVSPDGVIIHSESFKGKVVVLDFWASWCTPCWKVMPILNDLDKDFNDERIKILGINVWENPKRDPYKYFQEKGFTYQNLIDEDALLAQNFKIGFLPVIIVIDQKGIIRHISNGNNENLKLELNQLINELLNDR